MFLAILNARETLTRLHKQERIYKNLKKRAIKVYYSDIAPAGVERDICICICVFIKTHKLSPKIILLAAEE